MVNAFKPSDAPAEAAKGIDATSTILSNATQDQLRQPGQNLELSQPNSNSVTHLPGLELVSNPETVIPPVGGALSPIMAAIAEGRYKVLELPNGMQAFVPTNWQAKEK